MSWLWHWWYIFIIYGVLAVVAVPIVYKKCRQDTLETALLRFSPRNYGGTGGAYAEIASYYDEKRDGDVGIAMLCGLFWPVALILMGILGIVDLIAFGLKRLEPKAPTTDTEFDAHRNEGKDCWISE